MVSPSTIPCTLLAALSSNYCNVLYFVICQHCQYTYLYYMKKILRSALVLSVIASVSLVFAQVVEQVDTADSTIDCASITYSLRLGSKDSATKGDVSLLQTFLVQTGYLETDPTGYFGQATKRATQAFQKANGISPTGVVGTFTKSKISSISCTGQSVSGGQSGSQSQAGQTTTQATMPYIPSSQQRSMRVMFKQSSYVGKVGIPLGISWISENADKCSLRVSGGQVVMETMRNNGSVYTVRTAAPEDKEYTLTCKQLLSGSSTAYDEANASTVTARVTIQSADQASDQGSTQSSVTSTDGISFQTTQQNVGQNQNAPSGWLGVARVVTQAIASSTSGAGWLGAASQVTSGTVNSSPSSVFVSSPAITQSGDATLGLVYNTFQQESALASKFTLTISAKDAPVSISKSWTQNALHVNISYTSTTGASWGANADTITVLSGSPRDYGTHYTIGAHQTAAFTFAASVPPSKLFAGTYTGKLTIDDGQNVIFTSSQTNATTIIGEKSPYIKSQTRNGDTVTLTGERFDLAGNVVTLDGRTVVYRSKTATTLLFSIADQSIGGLTPGLHAVVVTNSAYGNSNTMLFETVASPVVALPSTKTPPVFNIARPPKVSIIYDSAQKESSMLSDFAFTVTTKETPAVIAKNPYEGKGSYGVMVAITGPSSGGMTYIPTVVSYIGASDDGTTLTIPANTTATIFASIKNFPASMFGGVYSSSFTVYDINTNQTVLSTTPSNQVSLIGETSPYVKNIEPLVNGIVTMTGTKLNASGNTYVMDDSVVLTGVTSSATSLSFSPAANGFTTKGIHAFQIKNALIGNGNRIPLDLPDLPVPQSTSPTMRIPVTPIRTLKMLQ